MDNFDIRKYIREAKEEGNRVSTAEFILPRGKKVVLQAEDQDYQRGLIVELTKEGGYKMNYWYGPDVKIYPVEVLVDGESIKEDAKEVYMKFHPELEEAELSKSETSKVKKVVKQLKNSVKAHDKQAKTLDKLID